MNEIEAMALQKAMKDIESMIDVLIHKQEDEIKSLKKAIKESFSEGLSEGMNKAWSLAQKIVHLDWDGNDNIHTVDDWFDMFTAKDAMEVMEMLDGKKPYWKEDIVRNVFECSNCGFASMIRYKFCPECGVKMEL